jgi:hypothetical protein
MQRKKIQTKKSVSHYINFRIIILGTVTAAIYFWLPVSLSLIVHSEELLKNNAKKINLVESSKNISSEYSLKTKIQYCKEDKKNKRDSVLCGQSIQLDKLEEMEFEKQTQPAEAKPEVKPQMQKSVATAPKIIIRKPVVLRISCAEKNDHPSKSATKGKHMDEDCCPDPDEWPKPGCVYSPSGRALMLKGKK